MYILLENKELIFFHKAKQYDVGTGYIALYDKLINRVLLCRYIADVEREYYYQPNLLFHCDNDFRTKGKEVIVIRKVLTFSEVDEIIDQIQKVLK